MSRVLPNRFHGVLQFQPESAAEQRAVAELRQSGYQVVFFLAGRHVLDAAPPDAYFSRFGLQGPAFIVHSDAATGLPKREALLAEARAAMQAFVENGPASPGYDVRLGDWSLAVRPLRAGSQACVACHTSGPGSLVRNTTSLRLGDALGLAMYLYRLERDPQRPLQGAILSVPVAKGIAGRRGKLPE